jgi:hypothetical protein
MTPLIRKFPLDRTGENPNNLVLGEPHELADNGRDGMRVFVPQYGAFYTQSLVIRDANGITLAPHSDYIATYYYEDASTMSGLEVCAAIVVLNPNIPSPVSIDYQVVGGDHAFSTTALAEVLETLRDNEQPVQWASIVGKPTMFPPGGHLHALWELYGFEYVTIQLERMVRAILVGDQATMDEIRAYALRLHEDGIDYTDALDSRFQDHLADSSNPHSVTKAQVGLGSVPNWPGANQTEAQQGDRNDRIMTPLRTAQAITTQALTPLNAHVNNTNNPHSVTKAQVGLGSVPDWPGATQAEAESGTRNDRIMTPLRTAQAISTQALAPLNSHVQNTNNPHSVTKVQVGLGSVPDWPGATQAEAESGTRNDRIMTPLRNAQAFPRRFNEQVQNGFSMPRNQDNSTLSFGSWNNDGAFIRHRSPDNNSAFLDLSCGNTTTGTSRKLQFGGGTTNNFSSWLTLDHDLAYFTGRINAVDYYVRSDERYKTNLRPIDDPLGRLAGIEGLFYEFIDDESHAAGLSAQQLQKVLPQAVRSVIDDDGKDRLHINHGGPIALLVSSVNALREIVDKQSAEIDRLKESVGER